MVKKQILINFVFGCVFIRSLFVIISYKINKKYLPILGTLAILPAIGFFLIYFKLINRKSGALGQKIWWDNLRPIHALLYLIFSYLAIKKSRFSYIPLLIDVLIGIISFVNNHYF